MPEKPMNVLSLFSGIPTGGLELGLERAGMTTVGQVELDPYCRQVLEQHWPEVPRHDDVRTAVEWWASAVRPSVDLACGGFPCQPFSDCGFRLGMDDERWMWPEFAAVVRAVRPRYVVVENVSALVRDGRAFGTVLADLHELGFHAEWATVRASDVGAPHNRERVFVVAYHPRVDGIARDCVGAGGGGGTPQAAGGFPRLAAHRGGRAASDWLAREPRFLRVPHGLSEELDEGVVGAEAASRRSSEDLSALRTRDGAGALSQRTAGGSNSLSSSQVLRPDMHGSSAGRVQPVVSLHAEVPEGVLRELWEQVATWSASPGRGSDEQLTRELAHALRDVSRETPLGDGQAVAAAARYVRRLREACAEIGVLRDSSDSLAQAWRCLPRQEASWVHLAACRESYIEEWTDDFRLVDGVPAQVDRLRVLGNAVVPQVAEHIGRLIMSAELGAAS